MYITQWSVIAHVKVKLTLQREFGSRSVKIRSVFMSYSRKTKAWEKASGDGDTGDVEANKGFPLFFVGILSDFINFQHEQAMLEAELSKPTCVLTASSNSHHHDWGPGFPRAAQRQRKTVGNDGRKEGISKQERERKRRKPWEAPGSFSSLPPEEGDPMPHTY